MSTVLFVLLCCLFYCSNALPAGFEDQPIYRVTDAVDVGFATEKNGRNLLFVLSRKGIVYTLTNFENDDISNLKLKITINLADEICLTGEQGLGGIVAHPDFANNRFIYIYYTTKNFDDNKTDKNNENYGCVLSRETGPFNILVRYRLKNDLTVDKNTEQFMLRTAPLHDKVHNGGDMAFGVDGMLYVTIGDAGERGLKYAQRTDNLFGTIVRLDDQGGIPKDNPFLGKGTARCRLTGKTSRQNICQEIFAYGLRNPFRFTMDPHAAGNKTRFLINDVGGKDWEETDVGGTDYAGVNYGFPRMEGPCIFASRTNCPVNDDLEEPEFWIKHNDFDQGALVGVAVLPKGLNWPSKYNSPSFFVAEFVFGKILLVQEDEDNYCRQCKPPRPNYNYTDFHEWPRIVGLRFGPYRNTQALYYTAREGSVNLRRIVYKRGGNSAPKADFKVDKEVVQVGGIVKFDASRSTDPDKNDKLSYEWDFGDGYRKKFKEIVYHRYKTGGSYIAKLIVKDSQGFTDTKDIEISVGKPPTVKITSPSQGTKFAVGDFFTIQGTGTDSEGKPLRSANFHWEVRQHHGDHYHPFFSKEGAKSIRIGPAPEPEDFYAATSSYLEVILTGYDSMGLHSTVSIDIRPKTVWMEFDTVPSGLRISIDEEVLVTPQRLVSWVNHKLRVIALDQKDYTFKKWSNGADQKDEFNVPARNTDVRKFVATYQKK